MKPAPLVSIVVPTYNHAQYLPICLDAIWFQDYQPLEIIVVNAASPDNTKEVLDTYQRTLTDEQVSFASNFNQATGEVERTYHARYPNEGRKLEIVHLESDPGLSETYNEGIRRANGEFVTAIVSDDAPLRTMISTLVQALQNGFDFAYSDEYLVDDRGQIVRHFEFPDFSPEECLANWYLLGNSKLWRRSLHEKSGLFSTDYPLTQDYELFARFFMDGASFVHVPEVLYSLRFHGADRKTGNHSSEREPKIFEESKDIALRVRAHLANST